MVFDKKIRLSLLTSVNYYKISVLLFETVGILSMDVYNFLNSRFNVCKYIIIIQDL